MHQFIWAAASRAVAIAFAFRFKFSAAVRRAGRNAARVAIGGLVAAVPFMPMAPVPVAQAGSISFSGTVVNAANSSFEVSQTRVTAFGDEAGIRLNAFNGESMATHLVASVMDQNSQPVPSALLGPGAIVPAGGSSQHILVVKLDQNPHQTFKVCLKQHTTAQAVSARKCFLLEVDRI